MNGRHTPGIVLKVGTYGEADKVVTFYSPDIGRATAIAKGANRSMRRFVNKLEPFSLLHIQFQPPRSGSLLFLSSAELENSYLSLRRNYSRYLCACALCEMTLRFTREQDADPAIFDLLYWGLARLEGKMPPEQTVTFFLLKLLDSSGYRPEINRCADCGNPVKQAAFHHLQPGSGSLLCSDCLSYHDRSGPTLSGQTLAFLKRAQELSMDRLDRLQIPPHSLREAFLYLHRYSLRILQREITSLHLMTSLFEVAGNRQATNNRK